MKKLISIICVIAIAGAITAGCSKSSEKAEESSVTVTVESTEESTTESTTETTTESTTESTTATTTTTTTTTTTEQASEIVISKEQQGSTKATTTKATTTKAASVKGVGVKIGGVTFKPNAEMTAKMKKLAKSEPEVATSCLGKKGYDVMYDFGNVSVTCFKKSKNAKEHIYEIALESGKLTNGVKIGDSVKNAKKKFSVNFKEDDGIYTYSKNGVKIQLYESGSKVDEIILQSTTI